MIILEVNLQNKRLRLSRETIIQLDTLIAARRIKIHAHLRARVFIMYGVFGIHFLASTTSSFPMSAHSVRVGEKFLRSLRVILYMGAPQIFNFWGERKQQSPNDASVIHCDLLAERESTAQTFLRPLVATSDNRCVPIVCLVLGDISPSISRLAPPPLTP